MTQSDLEADGRSSAPLPSIAVPELTPTRTALLVVDMTKGQAHPDYGLGALARAKGLEDSLRGYYERVRELVSNILRLREVVRASGGEVIYIRTATQTREFNELGDSLRAAGHCLGICSVHSAEAEFLDELQPSEREIVIDKFSISPFNSCPLDQILRNLETEAVIITGVRTDEAVELTAHGAADRGYWVVLVSDACTGVTSELHQSGLRVSNVLMKVKSTNEVLGMFLENE